MSNFFPSPVVFDRVEYPTVEHAYQAAKLPDEEYRKNIRNVERPGDAKRLGKGMEHIRAKLGLSSWESIREGIMRELINEKFDGNRDLSLRLLATGLTELVEWNTWHDCFWGRCICDDCGGQGENMLGRILMDMRGMLRNVLY